MTFNQYQLSFIENNFDKLTSKEIFSKLVNEFHLKHQYTSFRTELYRLGFYKVEMRRWSRREKQFLLENYKKIGNKQIAKLLSTPGRKFTDKQVQKKIRLLELKRTKEDLQFIIDNHKKSGVYSEGNYKKWRNIKGVPSISISKKEEIIVKPKLKTIMINSKIRILVPENSDIEKLKTKFLENEKKI